MVDPVGIGIRCGSGRVIFIVDSFPVTVGYQSISFFNELIICFVADISVGIIKIDSVFLLEFFRVRSVVTVYGV